MALDFTLDLTRHARDSTELVEYYEMIIEPRLLNNIVDMTEEFSFTFNTNNRRSGRSHGGARAHRRPRRPHRR